MAFKLGEMVQETSTTPGTGTYSLAGAVSGYRAFSSGQFNSGDTTIYTAWDSSGTFEEGIGTWTSGGTPTLSRDVILRTSAGTLDPINWGAGERNIISGLPGVCLEGALNTASPGLVLSQGAKLSTTPVSSAGLTLISQSDYSAMRSELSLRITPDATPQVQTFSSYLTTIAGLSRTDRYVIIGSSGTWTSRLLALADLPSGIDAETVKGVSPLGAATSVGFYDSGNLSFAADQTHTLTHSLGARPRLVTAHLKCTSANQGYSVDDEIICPTFGLWGEGFNYYTKYAVQVVLENDTAIKVIIPNPGTSPSTADHHVANKSTRAIDRGTSAVDRTKWALIIRAWT